MSPELPVVDYCPQAPEPGGCTPEPVPYPASIRRVVSPWVCDLEVAGPEGTYAVPNCPAAATHTPGCYTPPAGTSFPIGFDAIAEVAAEAHEEPEEESPR